MSKKKLISLGGVLFVLVAIPATVFLVGQRQLLGQRAQTVNRLICDSGTDPYNSTTITATNNSGQNVDLSSYVFRCTYKPNRIKKGYYYCDSNCNPAVNPDCDVGVWDPDASVDFTLSPGQSRTLSMTVNPCEIAQIDVSNPVEHAGEDATECWNTRSQYINPPPPNFWPGGIAFGIAENPIGYDAATGTCPQPTSPQPTSPPPTNPPYIPPTATPRPSQPTAPPGQPTYTPYPTQPPVYYPTKTPYPTQAPVYYSPVPTRPVAGSGTVTIIGILGGLGLLVLAIL